MMARETSPSTEVALQTLPVRIGVLVPSLDPVVEHDFQRFMPAAASFHVARLDQSTSSKPANDESLARMCDQAPERARPLADLGAELIMFCCTSGSFLRGFGWDRELARRIEEAVGVPALTTSSAVAEALAALGIRRIFMVTRTRAPPTSASRPSSTPTASRFRHSPRSSASTATTSTR